MIEKSGRYDARGVSSSKNEVHQAISNLGKFLFPKSFCKIVPDFLAHDPEYCLAMHADGAGTKSALAYLYWKETGDISVWKGIAQDALIMNIDDLLCAGFTQQFMVSSTIGRNKKKIPGEVIKILIEGAEDVMAELRKYGIDLQSTGGETADVGDLVKTVIVDSTVISRQKRSEVITNERISAGDVIIGLASDGQADYESEYNSGIGSNGLTSARHDVLAKRYAELFPESFDAEIPKELIYSGSKNLSDPVSLSYLEARSGKKIEINTNVGKLLLSPTRTYAPIIKEILKNARPSVKGMVHCTGGGQGKTLKFIQDLKVVKDKLFEAPPVFRMIQKESGAGDDEMYSVFNMGHRIEIFTEEKNAAEIISIARSFNIHASIIGYCEPSEGSKVILKTAEREIEFQ
jgi:phosphoribosylformylglycinamidine cyclo-ligase